MAQIRTRSGKLVDPLNLSPGDICISDIATSLSMQCRFNGHTRRFYSVAEHCIRVSKLVLFHPYGEGHELYALLHDASEAYLKDLPRPLKQLPEFAIYRKVEDRIQRTCLQKFGLDPTEPPAVYWADKESCKQEGSVLMNGWLDQPERQLFPPIRCFGPEEARLKFLDRFSCLSEKRREIK